MEDPTNPQNSKFVEDLQKASQEIEADIQRKKPKPEVKEKILEKAEPPKEGFDKDLVIRAEEVTEEKKRLEEIQKNLEKN